MHESKGWLLESSIADVRTIWFRAALAARYEIHPPSLLSAIEPTRAESTAIRASVLRGKRRPIWLSIKAGPIALIRIWSSMP